MNHMENAKKAMEKVENAERHSIQDIRLYIEASFRRTMLNTVVMLNNGAPATTDIAVLSDYHQNSLRILRLTALQFNTEMFSNGSQLPAEQNRIKNINAGRDNMNRIIQQFDYFSNIEIRDEHSYRTKLRELLGNVWNGFLAYRNTIMKLEEI